MMTMNQMQSPYAIAVRDSLTFDRINKNYRRGITGIQATMNQIDQELLQVIGNTIGQRIPTEKDQFEYRGAFRELCQHVGIADINGVVTIKL
jgi:hypothetical protein